MYATDRWIYHFVRQLECVKCRSKSQLTLYFHTGERVEGSQYSVRHLKDNLDNIDVWCPNCTVTPSLKRDTAGRRRHKEEAARNADINVASQYVAKYDLYWTPYGHMTKKQLLKDFKRCPFCHNYTVKFYNQKTNIESMPSSIEDLEAMIVAIQDTACECIACDRRFFRLYKNGWQIVEA